MTHLGSGRDSSARGRDSSARGRDSSARYDVKLGMNSDGVLPRNVQDLARVGRRMELIPGIEADLEMQLVRDRARS